MEGKIIRIGPETVDPGSDRRLWIRLRGEVPRNPIFEGGSAELEWIRVGSNGSPRDRPIHERFRRSGGLSFKF
ncbi:hypothetical protein Taro_024866 [Colocasia esculenta]|uniref:Uncharacterized protein n=1 Tax=Colocasia esculenta TaxID=4460 RepID=A0A843VIR5_COLES|nr:hypothetical protein [Colocasia esculenta]